MRDAFYVRMTCGGVYRRSKVGNTNSYRFLYMGR